MTAQIINFPQKEPENFTDHLINHLIGRGFTLIEVKQAMEGLKDENDKRDNQV